ncbi:helix-turn-helix transcriptional regulator [Corynebacterium striatum]|uniref:helix-turn-helix transcriptional regulator n=1 Tax=Corynebacterium striatum TaxID=43770 RepID=UPI00254DC509|nr:DNA-binding protein [Corynebacterium striatum]MDK8831607.1 DNA-binding protein [Corynebacterium striatum]MDK8844513.1 DNA-binding protein [Corynebacterium striatum]
MSLLSPATVSVRQAATLLGISFSSAYAAIRADNFPTKVIQIGGRYVVPTAPLLELLGLDELPDLEGSAA